VINGRVVDNVNRITHSEGQGYAMLIAVRASDRATFNQIWRWTQRELYVRSDGLASWKWEEAAKPHVTDPNNATDGDLLIAWALAEAGERWKSTEYLEAARRIASAIGRRTIARSPFGLMMMPGVDGFLEGQQPDAPVINLSYWVFPAFDALRRLSPEVNWSELQSTGLRLLRNSRFGPVKLPSDWVALGSGSPQPAQNFPARFSYNAIRIPLYLAWVPLDSPSSLRPFAGLWNEAVNVGPFEIDVASGSALQSFAGTGFKAIAAVVSCALDQRKLPKSVRTVSIEDYYPTTLHILSLIVIHERYPQCL
jgi:endoglucanase